MIVQRSANSDAEGPKAWADRWGDLASTLVTCWDHGRLIREGRSASHQGLMEQVTRGELPSLAWKGGFEIDPDDPEKMPKMKKKYGCLQYLATLQGMRGEDLSIDTEQEVSFRCARTNVVVVFTADSERWTVG